MKHTRYTAFIVALLTVLAAGAQELNDFQHVRKLEVSPASGAMFVWDANGEKHTISGSDNGSLRVGTFPLLDVQETVGWKIEQNPALALYTQALQATGLMNDLKEKAYDLSWDCAEYWNWEGKIYMGAQWDYCRVPRRKSVGFTIFACTDEVLKETYAITSLQTFYDYARSIYGGPALNATDPANAAALKQTDSPLRRLLAYNILNRKCAYDRLTTITSIRTNLVNPTEWYATLDPLTTMKVDRATLTTQIEEDGLVRNDHYLNRGDRLRDCLVPGIHVLSEGGMLGINGNCFLTEGLADYGQETQSTVFNTRMRISLTTIFPELRSNDLINQTPWDLTSCEDVKAPAANYWFPNGYLDGVKVNEEGKFIYQGSRSWYWCYQGDEFDLISEGNDHDITFTLPSVPTGTYQIRLGTCLMSSRGTCQFYLDDQPVGAPVDLSDAVLRESVEWISMSNLEGREEEERNRILDEMHAKGWYHGPASVFTTPYGTKDGTSALNAISSGNYFCNQSGTLRYVICTTQLDGSKPHTLRCKMVEGKSNSIIQMDYLEFVPQSVFDGPVREDIY